MEFFIKKNATLPLLKMELINDGRYTFNKFHELIQSSEVLFSMKNVTTNKYVILNKKCLILPCEEKYHDEEYYICYQFTEKETNVCGEYICEFTMKSDSGILKLPIREDLFVVVK